MLGDGDTSATSTARKYIKIRTHTEAGGKAPGAKALADVAKRAAAARKSLAMVVLKEGEEAR
jgi:hypothetical protein